MIEKNPLVSDASDIEQVKRGQRKERSIRQQEIEDVRYLLSTHEGRRFIWRYLDLTGIFRNSFDGTFRTYFNEGQRLIGTTMLADITDADPTAFAKMIQQQKDENE